MDPKNQKATNKEVLPGIWPKAELSEMKAARDTHGE